MRDPDESPPLRVPYDAVILAGGTGERLGGVDKAELVVGGRTLLARAVGAVARARTVVVVGPGGDVSGDVGRRVVVTSEEPPGGGPVAALAAGIVKTDQDVLVALACDMPLVDATFVEQLVGHLVTADESADAALAVDADGRRQFLAGAYRRAPLIRALSALGEVRAAAMRSVVNRLTVVEVVTDPVRTLDADTWDDLERARRLLEEP
jgi:molybdopterin-guanine dinucleotide biosynthesis protein A